MSHGPGYVALTVLLAGCVTLFDLDQAFFAPGPGPNRTRRSGWWWGFVAANASLAAVVFFALRGVKPFADWNPWLYATAVGISYLGLVRLKFATVTYKSEEVPVGLDTFYESGRQFVFKRINEMVKVERQKKAETLIAGHDLKSLGSQVRMNITLDSLLTPEERKTRLSWLLTVIQDNAFDDDQKKLTLAAYLAAGTQI